MKHDGKTVTPWPGHAVRHGHEFPERQRRIGKTKAIRSTVTTAVLAGGTAFSTALIAAYLWASSTPLIYEQSESMRRMRVDRLVMTAWSKFTPSGEGSAHGHNYLSYSDRDARARMAVWLEVV